MCFVFQKCGMWLIFVVVSAGVQCVSRLCLSVICDDYDVWYDYDVWGVCERMDEQGWEENRGIIGVFGVISHTTIVASQERGDIQGFMLTRVGHYFGNQFFLK